jgi:DNA-directed RNA polymerase subunit RPC12/RpoP
MNARFIAIQVYSNYIDANIVMGRLEEDGIQCWLKDENTVTLDPILTNAVGGIKLMVNGAQAERAAGILKALEKQKRDAYACPNCGSHNIEYVSTPRKATNWLSAIATFFLGDFAMAVDKVYHCFDCSFEFETPVETVAEPLQNEV